MDCPTAPRFNFAQQQYLLEPRFDGVRREVYLEGNAFYYVKRNTERPIFTHTGENGTKVLGTSFWVNGSDHNSAIEVSVVTGKVSVSEYGKANSTKTSKIKDGVILTANQRVKYTTQTHSFETGLVSNPIPVATDKKGKPFEGSFVFEDNSFSDVIGRREKAYGIEIIPGSQNTAGSMLSRLGIYLTPWQGRLITNDFRANRTNSFKLAEQGSGYALKQMEDLMWTDDVAFRPVDINVGPMGLLRKVMT